MIRYSEAFKLQVVSEIASGRHSCAHAAARAYDIRGSGTVPGWLRKYGQEHLLKKVVRVTKKGEQSELQRLRRRTRELEKLVADLTIDRALSEAGLELLCEQHGLDPDEFKKKAAGSARTGLGSSQGSSRA